jgi:hypothetical protein
MHLFKLDRALVVMLVALVLMTDRAMAVPSYAMQTGQPCAACHVGAFGPQLKQVGRDFKLFGYSSTDTKDHFPPIAFTTQSSFTHVDTQQPGAAPHFGPNDNVAVDQVSLSYAGRIVPDTGAFAQFTYDGIARQFHWDKHRRTFTDPVIVGQFMYHCHVLRHEGQGHDGKHQSL